MPESVKDQIDAMLNIGADPEPDPVEPDPEPIEPEPEVDPVVDPEPEPEPDPEPEPEVDPEPEPEPEPDPDPEPADELDRIKEENEKLRKQIEEAHTPKGDPEPHKVEEPEPEPEPEPIIEVDFLGDVDLDELSRDPKALNALLNKVHSMGIESQRTYQEGTLRSIPDIVKSNIAIQSTLAKGVEQFYLDNEDLRPFSAVCGAVYEELASENPDWTVTKTFDEVGKESRNRLELHKKATDPEPDPKKKSAPKFANTKGKRARQKPKTDSLLDEIDAMNTDT